MDKDLEEMIKTCHACQIMANPTQATPVNTTKLPDRPWKKLGIDLTGPFTNNEYFLVVIDYYSRFPEVEIVRSITSATIINKLRKNLLCMAYVTNLYQTTETNSYQKNSSHI